MEGGSSETHRFVGQAESLPFLRPGPRIRRTEGWGGECESSQSRPGRIFPPTEHPHPDFPLPSLHPPVKTGSARPAFREGPSEILPVSGAAFVTKRDVETVTCWKLRHASRRNRHVRTPRLWPGARLHDGKVLKGTCSGTFTRCKTLRRARLRLGRPARPRR